MSEQAQEKKQPTNPIQMVQSVLAPQTPAAPAPETTVTQPVVETAALQAANDQAKPPAPVAQPAPAVPTQVPAPQATFMSNPANDTNARNSQLMKLIRDRFLRNFVKVEVCDAINIDTSGGGGLPTGHLHIRFYMTDEARQQLDTYKKLGFLGQEIDRGKYLLTQYGISKHDEAVIEKVHPNADNHWLQYDCDFEVQPERRSEALKAIEADLQKGIEEAKKARGANLSAA